MERSKTLITTRDSYGVLRRWHVTLAFFTMVTACCALAIDLPVARLVRQHELPGDLRRVVMASEFFGHGLSVLLLIWAAGMLDGRRWRVMGGLTGSAFLPGLLSTAFKGLVARRRPAALLSDLTLNGDVWSTFVGWLPVWQRPMGWGYELQSFPSSHTATAVGLAVGLSTLYPQGRVVFMLFACLVGLQRIFSEAHYASDVIFGAAVGFAGAGWWVTSFWFRRLLENNTAGRM